MTSWCWAMVTVLSGSCSPCRTAGTGAQHLTQESHRCLHHTSKWGWTHSLHIHSQKLFQSSASTEPAETCSSCEASTTCVLTTPLPTGLGRALKRRGGCFTCCQAEYSWWVPVRQRETELYIWCHVFLPWRCCGAMRCSSSKCGRRAAHQRKPAPAQGLMGTAGKQLALQVGERLGTSSSAGEVAPLGSASSYAGEDREEKHWA